MPLSLLNTPILTERLLLRAFVAGDAADLVALAGDKRVADTMISLPHPYTLDYAQAWIELCHEQARTGKAVHFALIAHQGGELLGAAGIRAIELEHEQAELSFWLGHAWWGQGLATEATGRLLELAFTRLGLNRIYAYQMARNSRSAGVLRRIGMRREGLLRQRVKKWGQFEDVYLWAEVRQDWAAEREG